MNEQTATETTAGAVTETAQQPNPGAQTEQTEPRTYTQEDVDRIVSQRLSRYQRDEAQRIEQAKQQARTEAEQLAKMTEEQRAQHAREAAEHDAEQREQKLKQREADIQRRELRVEALDSLASRGLPKELLDMLDYSSAEACDASIKAIDKVWKAAVQGGIDERLKASGVSLVSRGSTPDYDSMTDAEYYAATAKPKT